MAMLALMLILCITVAWCDDDVQLIEGDIVLDEETQDIIDGKVAYDGMISRKWPDGIIPYAFSSHFDINRINVVLEAVAEYNKHTCIRFVPRSNEKNYVLFMRGGGCYSSIGMTGRGRQKISIGSGCQHKGIVMHEMMHAAGFFHEQSRLDRDDHITIYWENIRTGMEFNFKKYSHGEAETFGEPYDLDSIMHYGRYAFSMNRKPTILANKNPGRKLGQRHGFSDIDIRQLIKMYNCGTVPKPSTNPPITRPTSLVTTIATTSIPKTSVPKSTKPGCKDEDKSCLYWARVGFCKSMPKYMKENCRKSCRMC